MQLFIEWPHKQTKQRRQTVPSNWKILFSTIHLNTETSKMLPTQSTLELSNAAKLTEPQERTAYKLFYMKIDSSEIPGAVEIYLFQNFMFMQRKELELLLLLYSFWSHMYLIFHFR